MAMLGHQRVGKGPLPVLVLNDWISDTSSWEAARPYLDERRFEWIFTDVRGYGRSRDLAGRYVLEEVCGDVLELADALGLRRFALVGHSMSSLAVYQLAQRHPERLLRGVVLGPVPPRGLGVPPEVGDYLESLGRGDDAARLEGLRATWGDRLSEGWLHFKAERWRAVAKPEAAAAYARMFARDGLPDPERPLRVPLLAVTGEQDGPPMRRAAVEQSLSPLCEQLEIVALADTGHYPMQEAPPLTVAVVERFLAAGAG